MSDFPMASRKKKSMFQAISGKRTPTAAILASNELSHHSAGTVRNRAISENQRKLAAPYWRKLIGIKTQTKSVQAILSQSGITGINSVGVEGPRLILPHSRSRPWARVKSRA